MTDSDMVELAAEAIYDLMPFDEPHGTKPAWVPRGNSLKQDEARSYARAAIRAMEKPTEEMYDAAWERIRDNPELNKMRERVSIHEIRHFITSVYFPMIRAAPGEE